MAAPSAVGGDARRPVLVLTGPTGVGKTDWAVALAEHAPIEIISVDSTLVYRGLDIGTAKPAATLRARIPHHLVDICEPTESYSAGRFVTDALASIRAVHGRGRIPLLVGGTMLYLRALFHGLASLPQASPALRQDLDAQARRLGWPALHAQLAQRDPQAAARISPGDSQRIQRALEVCLSTGRPISELQRATVSPLADWPQMRWVLAPGDRAHLHERLARRFAAMMAAGFLAEVAALRARGDLSERHPAMRAVGYRQLWAHLEGECTLEEAVSRGVAATRQLAKRQLTWLRADAPGNWLDPQHTNRLSWIRDITARLAEFGL